jgi:hypothetical protein
MQAYQIKSNRPLVIKTYKACRAILEKDLGIDLIPVKRKFLKESIGSGIRL